MEEKTEIKSTEQEELVTDNINVAENQQEENLEEQEFEEGGEVEENVSLKLNWGSVLTFF
tara:strand:+ start:316 stop:495 length:180 start_codon:yes stop_codon:yes gene_type:complete